MLAERLGGGVVARIHDNTTSNQSYEWRSLIVRWPGGQASLEWYGEHLFRAAVPDNAGELKVCATDVAGNKSCEQVT